MIFDDRELVDRQPVVISGNVEVDHAGLRATDGALIDAILDRHTLHQHPVEGPVARFQRRAFRPIQLAKSIFQRLGGQSGIELNKGIPQPPFQDHLPIVSTLGSKCVWRNVGPVRNAPAKAIQPVESGLFDHGFGDA